jgi:branched-chain amino acid transport system substrate-binding protein
LAGLSGAVRAEQKPLRFGISVSLTGPFAEAIRPAMLADKVWQEEVNARGGLLGRKVELSIRDNRSSADDGVSIYERFLQEKQDFVFEDSGAFLVQRVSPVAEQHKMLMLAPNAFARSLYQRGFKYLFYTGAALSEDLIIGAVRLLQSLPVAERPKTVGYVTVLNIAFTSMAKGMQEQMSALQTKTVLDVTYPPSLNDGTPIIENLKQANPDMIAQTGLVNDTLLLMRAMKQQGYRPKVTLLSVVAGAQPNFLQTFGDSVEGAIYSSSWEPQVKTTGNAAFVAAYQKANGMLPTYNGAQAYARWQIFETAVTATKSFDQKTLRDYIATHEFDTVVGKIKYDGKSYSVPTDTIVTQVQHGKKVVVWPPDQAAGKFVMPSAH